VRERLDGANNPAAEGVAIAGEMLAAARESFDGVYIMPPFDRYDAVADILG
ncbi:MAG: homocysteine methyltransferase, partial [Deltaproteobacteria bacterium]